ncbi:MAG: hypothetical protein U0525_04720 [Patescibacteria group bacterium]
MTNFIRNAKNPILGPNPENAWESFAAFNGCIVKEDSTYFMIYRAMPQTVLVDGKNVQISNIGVAKSIDGENFSDRKIFIKPEHYYEKYGCEDPRTTKIDGKFYTFYTAISAYPPNRETIKVAVAISDNFDKVLEKHLVTPFNAKGMTLFPEKIDGMYTVALTVNTDMPPAKIAIAQFENIETLWDSDFWTNWYENLDEHTIPLRLVSIDQIEVGAPPIKTKEGWLFIYSYIRNYFTNDKDFRIEAALLDMNNPQKIIGRIETPLISPKETYEKQGQIQNVTFPEGALIDDDKIRIYYGAADSYCCEASADLSDFMKSFDFETAKIPTFKRFANNPLLLPNPKHPWESQAVFNPGVIEIEGKIYLLYRALSDDNISTVGLAISYDGMYIDERLDEPIYVPRAPEEISNTKGQGYGCEDPRITRIGDVIYMCYTAYDGVIPRLAMTSIYIEDFLERKWNKWKYPKIISRENIADKDGCLFPEKINGKYVFFHRVEPNINIDYVDDLLFEDTKYLEIDHTIPPGTSDWDSVKIGINAPPIKCSAGWLVLYHGISASDHHYRLGAMLLDENDPTKLIARTRYPILEPELYYELEGVVNNVVFPCGAVVIEKYLYIYYGGADKVVGGARMPLEELVTYLMKSRQH